MKIAKCNLGTQCTFSRTQAKGSRYIPYYWRLGLETGDVAVGEGEGKVVVVMQYTGGELHWPELTTKLPGSFQGGRRGAGRGAGRGQGGGRDSGEGDGDFFFSLRGTKKIVRMLTFVATLQGFN